MYPVLLVYPTFIGYGLRLLTILRVGELPKLMTLLLASIAISLQVGVYIFASLCFGTDIAFECLA
jgi:hypothetical protein